MTEAGATIHCTNIVVSLEDRTQFVKKKGYPAGQ